jgi:hypothetical protein
MKRLLMAALFAVALLGTSSNQDAISQEIKAEDCFFVSSLHYTASGMEYWYSKKNGGLELLTEIPYDQLTCKNCHTPGCDGCHKAERGEKECKIAFYSTEAAKKQDKCLKCHGREQALIKIDHEAKQDDVHILKGMVCGDCHSAKEMHGDGTQHISLKEPGAMDTQCENCHDSIKPTEAHTVHERKLDCKACHIRHVVSCTNCHFDTLLEKGKRVAIPVSGWVFLINYEGKVTSASMQTFVTKGDKTFLMFAPHTSHSVTKEGRACNGCHGTKNMKAAQKGRVKLTWLENGTLTNLKGVIPITDDAEYECVYQNLENDKWIPIKNPMKPVRQYAAFGKPLTKEQMKKLAEVQKAPPPKMP